MNITNDTILKIFYKKGVIHIVGDVKENRINYIRESLLKLIGDKTKKITIDLRGCTHFDISAISILTGIKINQDLYKKNPKMKIIISSALEKQFNEHQLDQIFDIRLN